MEIVCGSRRFYCTCIEGIGDILTQVHSIRPMYKGKPYQEQKFDGNKIMNKGEVLIIRESRKDRRLRTTNDMCTR